MKENLEANESHVLTTVAVAASTAASTVAVAAASILARAEFVRRLAKLEEEAGCALPKGAGTEADRTASRLFLAGGEALLRKFAKMHFRTARKAMGLPPD